MAKIFISYARVDIYLIKQLVGILYAGGHEPWFDHRLIPGQDWKAQLIGGIELSDAFVYALTPESVASQWCQWEFARAIEQGKPIIPVMFQSNTQLPELLTRYQYVDFTEGPTPEATARLMSGLWNLAVKIPPHEAPLEPMHPHGFPSRVPDDVIEAIQSDTSPIKKTREAVLTKQQLAERLRTRTVPHRTQPQLQVIPARKRRNPNKRLLRTVAVLVVGILLVSIATGVYLALRPEDPTAKAQINDPTQDGVRPTLGAERTESLESCNDRHPSRLEVGDRAWVPLSLGSRFSLRLHTAPGENEPLADRRLYAGMVFDVIDGPDCADGHTWWRVRVLDNDVEGWAAESDQGGYFMAQCTLC
jgi:hypothetical protein